MAENQEETQDQIQDEFHTKSTEELAVWLDENLVSYSKPASKTTLLSLCRAIAQVKALQATYHGNSSEVELVSVWKDGEELEVHPSCVANHVELGWKVKG